jgi:hypothetical protein
MMAAARFDPASARDGNLRFITIPGPSANFTGSDGGSAYHPAGG